MSEIGWRDFTLTVAATLSDALEVLNATGMQIVLVSDSTGHLVGTLTDGDLRQAFLRQARLTESVESYLNRHPRTIAAGTDSSLALEIMRRLAIRALPMVDEQGVITDVLTLDALIRPVERETPVVIMAGGRGTRLGHLTRERPKPLVQLVDEPLAEVILRQLVAQGFHRVYFSVNFRADDIKAHFEDGHRYGITVSYLEEAEPLGTAGSLRLLPDGPWEDILVVNGDLVTSADFGALMDIHVEDRADATIGMHEHLVEIPYGVVQVRERDVIHIEEKPVRSELVSAGVTALSRGSLRHISAGGPTDMPQLLRALLGAGARVRAWPLRSYWMDVGTLDQLERARRDHDLGKP